MAFEDPLRFLETETRSRTQVRPGPDNVQSNWSNRVEASSGNFRIVSLFFGHSFFGTLDSVGFQVLAQFWIGSQCWSYRDLSFSDLFCDPSLKFGLKEYNDLDMIDLNYLKQTKAFSCPFIKLGNL